ncbi:unnamed protein product [Gongylonema pulchrum]|uniref:Phosphorylase b kinase regulatory subunit n=1 Tax=Gongylonema pulchrum TaxID=637853 RepID=A0A183EYJ6_9BILA|nr:unnamed protein product [Gongylonema pulchrum]VDN45017.1 unnamed protein product [Gongylonema pulchrum]
MPSYVGLGSMEGNPVVQVVLIAESSRLQMMLSTYGISTQTPHDLEPVQIWPSWKMVKVCTCSPDSLSGFPDYKI